MTKEETDQKYIDQHGQLEAEFFDIVDEGLPNQHRVLKDGKAIEEFNQRHGDIWRNHGAELIAGGFREPMPERKPPRSTHFAKIDSFHPDEPKPLRVVRTWQGKDYTYDCYVTQTLKDEFVAGNVVVGDYVLIHFNDQGKEVAMMKILKTW